MTEPIPPIVDFGGPVTDPGSTVLADDARRLAAVSAERDEIQVASFRQRERLLDQIDRKEQSLRERDEQLRQARSQLAQTRAQLATATARIGYRVQRTIGHLLIKVVDRTRVGGRRALDSIATVRGRVVTLRTPKAPPRPSPADRERALADAIVSGLPVAQARSNASVTVVLRWSGDPSHLRVVTQRLEEAHWSSLDIRVVSSSEALEAAWPGDVTDGVTRVSGVDLEDSYRSALADLRSDYVLFMSDSIEPLEPDWLARLVGGAEASGAGAAGARLVFGIRPAASSSDVGSSSDLRLSHGGLLLAIVEGLARVSVPTTDDPLDPQIVADRYVAAVDGACLLVRREALADVGPVRAADLDGSAVSLCLRIRRHGWPIRFVGSAVAWDRRGSAPKPDLFSLDTDTPDPRTLFRDVMSDRLSGSFAISEGPVRVAIVGDAGARIQERLADVGLAGPVMDLTPSGPDLDSAIEVVLLLDPTMRTEALPRHIVRAAWLGDRPDPWMDSPGFEDLDIVLVADEPSRARVEARTAKAAWVAADPATPSGAQAFKDALARWVAARHVAIHIAPPTWEAATTWGDTPFGRDIQKAFERRGWPATVHVHAERDSAPAVRADLSLHVHGIRVPGVRPWQISVLWIISHPDLVRRDQCLAYDLIGVGSDQFLRYLEGWLGGDGPPLISLHQATDADRFFPEPGGPAHDILFVGSSRNLRRPFLDALAGTPFDLAVYGRKWSPELLDPRHVRGEWIPNDVLHRYYASAGIVLSDSWADMRDEGFIANRIYDALASGAFVLSEGVPGLDQEFDGSVITFRDREELLDRIEYYLARPGERAALAETGRRAVLARHTFGHRVDAILVAVEPLLAAHDDSLLRQAD